MSQKEKNHYFHGDQWFDRKVDERTRQSLKDKEAAFPKEHHGDSDDELLLYIRKCAHELGHTPLCCEIIGGTYLSQRFGSWEKAVYLSGLQMRYGGPIAMKDRDIYKREFKEQAKLFKQGRRDGTDPDIIERKARSEAARIKEEQRRERDKLWGQAHKYDTDEQLLEHVCQCAKELGRSPRQSECPGAEYVVKRFGSWSMVLTCAHLPLLSGMQPPTNKVIKAYKDRRKVTHEVCRE